MFALGQLMDRYPYLQALAEKAVVEQDGTQLHLILKTDVEEVHTIVAQVLEAKKAKEAE
jgi:hypothetical protein